MSGSKKWTSDVFSSIASFYNSQVEQGLAVTSKTVYNELEAVSDHVFSMVSVQWHFGHFKAFVSEISSIEEPTEEDWRARFKKWLRVGGVRFTSTQKADLLRMGDHVRQSRHQNAARAAKMAKARRRKGGQRDDDEDGRSRDGEGNTWLTNAVSTVVQEVFGQEIQKACRRAIASVVADAVSKRVLRGIADCIQPRIADIIEPEIEKIRASRLRDLEDIMDGEDAADEEEGEEEEEEE